MRALVHLAFLVLGAAAQSLNDTDLDRVKARLAEGATHSWELGTRAEALTELDTPAFSVFANAALPPSQTAPGSLNETLGIARGVVHNLTDAGDKVQALVPSDGAAGDPASNLVAVVLANWTGLGATDRVDYAGAASDQIRFLLQDVPRAADGAISHRTEMVQLWSDFVYMVPPALAYYGMITSNQSVLQEAYNQIKLYRDNLRDTKAKNLWTHIVMGNSGTDPGHWSTGNAWAAAGMLRVLATIKNSAFASAMKSQQSDLRSWVNEIHGGMYANLDAASSLFHNYADDTSSFLDASSTALIASTVYRLASLGGATGHIRQAELSRAALSATNGSGGLAHFTDEGWLTPVVDPENVGRQGSESPEGQAFVLTMQAAWTQWQGEGSKGASCAKGTGSRGVVMGVAIAVLCELLVVT